MYDFASIYKAGMENTVVDDIIAAGIIAGRENSDDIEDEFSQEFGTDLGNEIISGRATKGTKRQYQYNCLTSG